MCSINSGIYQVLSKAGMSHPEIRFIQWVYQRGITQSSNSFSLKSESPATILISFCAAALHVYRWCRHRRFPAVSDCAGRYCFRHGISLQTRDHRSRWSNSPHRLPHQRLCGRNPQNQPKGWENTPNFKNLSPQNTQILTFCPWLGKFIFSDFMLIFRRLLFLEYQVETET